MTKNQILNTECQPKYFLLFQIEKEKSPGCLLLISNCDGNKNFGLHFGCFICFLVISRSNEKHLITQMYLDIISHTALHDEKQIRESIVYWVFPCSFL